MLGDNTLQWRAQLSERPVSGSCVDQSQDREGAGCCRHQTDGPNGPRSLRRQGRQEEVDLKILKNKDCAYVEYVTRVCNILNTGMNSKDFLK